MNANATHKTQKPESRPQGVEAVDVAVQLLRTILASDRPLRLKEIEQASGIASAKAYRYLVSLVNGGLVQRVDHHRYDFGLMAWQIAQRAAHRSDLIAMLDPLLHEFAEAQQVTCGLGLPVDRKVTMVRWHQPDGPITISLKPGLQAPYTTSSTGMVYAAWLTRLQTEPLVRAELAQQGNDTPAALEAYYQQLNHIRDIGMAQGLGLRIPGLDSLSAPVFDREGKVAFVVTAVGYSPSFDASLEGPTAHALRAFAGRLTAMQGGG